jgi:cobalt/nickel transport system permease protein
MHISEGVLSAPVLAVGGAIALAGTAWGLKKIRDEQLPRAALLSAVFFLASLIHVPIGPSSVHLILNGLVGIMLGWAAFPAILVALALQAILFQFGGLLVLGVNTCDVVIPAILAGMALGPLAARGGRGMGLLAGFLAGSLAVLGTAVLTAAALYFSGEAFVTAAQAIIVAHLPIAGIEGLITAFAVTFLQKVRPDALHSLAAASPGK